jgi:hypothetical protein
MPCPERQCASHSWRNGNAAEQGPAAERRAQTRWVWSCCGLRDRCDAAKRANRWSGHTSASVTSDVMRWRADRPHVPRSRHDHCPTDAGCSRHCSVLSLAVPPSSAVPTRNILGRRQETRGVAATGMDHGAPHVIKDTAVVGHRQPPMLRVARIPRLVRCRVARMFHGFVGRFTAVRAAALLRQSSLRLRRRTKCQRS